MFFVLGVRLLFMTAPALQKSASALLRDSLWRPVYLDKALVFTFQLFGFQKNEVGVSNGKQFIALSSCLKGEHPQRA